MRWTVVALVAIALLAAGCGGSSDRPAGTGAKQAAPPATAAHAPVSEGTEVSAATVRKLLAKSKSKASRQAGRKAASSPGGKLAQVARKGIARQIIRRLAAARRGHGSPVSHRLRKAIGHVLAQRKAKGGASSSSPGTAAQVVREIIGRAEEAK